MNRVVTLFYPGMVVVVSFWAIPPPELAGFRFGLEAAIGWG
jgi:hypothetical protein